MNKSKLLVGVVGGFLLGCAGSELASLVVPPARAGTSPQKWEYVCKAASGDADTTAMANAFGKEGWEMLGGAGNPGTMRWCFKRPLP